jgi:hypothetical protein
LGTEDFFRERANMQAVLRMSNRGTGEPPRAGDELLEDRRTRVEPALDHLLRTAIRTKHLVRFTYKSQERIAEPHDYGIQNGIVRLFCYQVGGQSGSRLPGWRLVDVPLVQNCEIMERRFAGNRDTASGKHHRWDEIFIRVEPPAKSG